MSKFEIKTEFRVAGRAFATEQEAKDRRLVLLAEDQGIWGYKLEELFTAMKTCPEFAEAFAEKVIKVHNEVMLEAANKTEGSKIDIEPVPVPVSVVLPTDDDIPF